MPNIATVEILKAGMRELIERVGQLLLRELRPNLRRLAVDEKCLAETDRLCHFRQLAGSERGLAARHHIALAGTADRSFEQHVARHLPAECVRRLQRDLPGRDRTGHGQRRERPARRDLVLAVFAIKLTGRPRAGRPRAHDGAHPALRLVDEPEGVAADVVHVRVSGGDRGRHGDHRLDGVAAVGQHGAAVLDRGAMRRANHAAAMPGGVKLGQASPAGMASASPRFCNSASTVGSRPRNAL